MDGQLLNWTQSPFHREKTERCRNWAVKGDMSMRQEILIDTVPGRKTPGPYKVTYRLDTYGMEPSNEI